MGLFGNRNERAEKLTGEVAELELEKEKLTREVELERELSTVREELAEARADRIRVDAERAEKDREVEHKVALHIKETEHDKKVAIKEAQLAAREENLAKQDELRDASVENLKEAMHSELETSRHILEQILSRVPTVNVDRQIRENYGPALEAGEAEEVEEVE